MEGAASVRYAVAVGTTRPYYASAAGRVVLAHKDDSWVSNYLDNTSLHSITAQTVTSRSRLLETLKDVRRSGVSLSFEEATDGGAGIAAPILASDGKLLSVLSIGAIASRARRNSEKYGNAVAAISKTNPLARLRLRCGILAMNELLGVVSPHETAASSGFTLPPN